jgi:MFS family permease
MRKNIYLMCVISFLQGLIFYGPIATIFRQSRGLSIYEIFIIESIFMVLMICLEIPWGYFADRFGYKKTLVFSYLLFFISKIVFYSAHSFRMFLLEAFISALSFSGISGCDSALIYSSAGEKHSEKAFSYYNASTAAGFFIASVMSSFLIKISLDITALVTIIPYFLAFLLSFFLIDVEYKKEHISIMESIKNAFKSKEIFIFVISMAIVSETTHSICVFLNQPKYFESGISLKYFGFLTAFMQIICIISAKSYKLSKRFGSDKVIKFLFIVITISSIALGLTKNPFIVIILIAVTEGAFALCQPLSSDIQNKSIKTNDRATLLSTYAMAGDIIASIINLSIGKIANISINLGFIACGIFSGIAFIMVFVFFRKSLQTN